jgi:uncharacterized membrane protein YgdD (TMEM256/DUF423 family)
MSTGNGWGNAVLLIAAGLVGAAGVAAAASASHGDSRNLGAIAMICLAHGPALLALGLAGRGRVLLLSGMVLALGTLLFVADLGLREWLGHALFPGAAPLAGAAMILGWLGLAIGGILALRKG